jgi:sugar transferase (PEP-CTERM/EpsH1 system associated)
LRVLVVAPYLPYPPWFGGAVRIYHLVRTLARDHEVTLLALATPAERDAARPLWDICAAVHTVEHPAGERWRRLYQARSLVGSAYFYYKYHSPELTRAMRALFARQTFDAVQIEFSQMAYCHVPDGPLRVLDEHNVEYQLLQRIWRNERAPLRRLYSYVQARKFRRDELAACRRMDAVLTTSLEDRNLLASELVGTPIRVVPNGVDTEFFRPGTEDEDPRKLLFTGAMNYAPNADGVAHFCADILPIIRAVVPEVSLSVVGRDPPPRVQSLAREGVAITGTVPDVRPWMNRAAVFVVPLRVGGGTRLKILEAMASGRPVVSTSLGCEGLDVKDGHNILVADTPAAFAAAVVRCLRDPELRRTLGAHGRALVQERYQWDAIGRGLSDFLTEMRESSARRAPLLQGRATTALADRGP